MRGVRSFTLVPSLSVSTNSDTGTGLSGAAYFGVAIFRTMSRNGGAGLHPADFFRPEPPPRQELYSLRRRQCTVTLRWIPVLILAQLGTLGLIQAQLKNQEHWVATWATAQTLVRQAPPRPATTPPDATTAPATTPPEIAARG